MDYRNSEPDGVYIDEFGRVTDAAGNFAKSTGDVVYTWEPNVLIKKKNAYSKLELLIASIIAAFFALFLLIMPTGFTVVLSPDSLKSIDYKVVIAVLALAVGVFLCYVQYRENASPKHATSSSFVDLDERASNRKFETQILELKHRLHTVNSKVHDVVDENPEVKVADSKQEHREFTSVESYIHGITKSLDRHIELSEKKASKLLDTGTMYLRRGIYFYVASIFVWQIIAHVWGVDKQLIFGVVSCSLTFLVVEFLAAWFLKQYRSFIDSSIQFMKVKSVFDRYLLSYYAVKEFTGGDSEDLVATKAQILKVLSEEIKWPEALNTKAADMNHMVQMFDSLSGMLEKIKKVSTKNDAGGA
ncbi:hypothetical protein FFI16_020460 [Pseudomonas sp. KBS0710]|uniref:hypothetical protein n=1 Tax=Pseudomonas sp. KBS0710 TaxID=1179667 RepID=UPI00110E7A9E|nr:hypothetical protein [Pseudomonas sp. KBS0710]TSD78694.1 hypothetical protein FFI16_020460 [Pseudomonas sp. KBS0710]